MGPPVWCPFSKGVGSERKYVWRMADRLGVGVGEGCTNATTDTDGSALSGRIGLLDRASVCSPVCWVLDV